MITPDTDIDRLTERIVTALFNSTDGTGVVSSDQVREVIHTVLAYEKSKVDPAQLKLNIDVSTHRTPGIQTPAPSNYQAQPGATTEYNATGTASD